MTGHLRTTIADAIHSIGTIDGCCANIAADAIIRTLANPAGPLANHINHTIADHRWTFTNGRGHCHCGWTATSTENHQRHIADAVTTELDNP